MGHDTEYNSFFEESIMPIRNPEKYLLFECVLEQKK
jgi:hypothetical protein